MTTSEMISAVIGRNRRREFYVTLAQIHALPTIYMEALQ